MKLQKDLREFVELLNSHRVRYLVVGGYAVAFHGHPRFTGDIDFFVEPSPENAARMGQVMVAFGFGSTDLSAADFERPGHVVQLGLPPNRIDVLTSIAGVSFDEAWATRVDALLDRIPVAFISKELLIRNKRSAGRTKDLADVEAIVGPGDGER